MKKVIYILLALFLVISCTSNTIYKKPENLIPKNQMVDLLVDMQIAISARSGKNEEGNYNVNYMPFVYEKYGIDSARFTQSSYYYSTDIDNYTQIMKRVSSKLTQMKKENDFLVSEKDSLDKLNNPVVKRKEDIKKNRILDSIVK